MEADYWEKEKPQFTDTPNTPYHAVPDELKALRQWVLWKNENRDGKPTKVPYQCHGNKAKSNEPSTWTDFKSAHRHSTTYDGIGFMFSSGDPYCGVDLDNCLENGKVKPWASPIVEKLKSVSYGEVSPSGNGIKFWTKAVLPVDAKHKVYVDTAKDEAIEVYDTRRYFTVMGEGAGDIRDGQAVIDWLVETYLKPVSKSPTSTQKNNRNSVDRKTADEVISLIKNSRQCYKFDALMRGDTHAYGSQSEADMAMCSLLAFWTQDARVIDSIFRTSQLFRDKWDEKHRADGATYGQMTIEKALSNVNETYTPANQKTRHRSKRRRSNERYRNRQSRHRYRNRRR